MSTPFDRKITISGYPDYIAQKPRAIALCLCLMMRTERVEKESGMKRGNKKNTATGVRYLHGRMAAQACKSYFAVTCLSSTTLRFALCQ